MNLDLYNPFIEEDEKMKQPKVYVMNLNKVMLVSLIDYGKQGIKVIGDTNLYRLDETVLLQNTGFKDKSGNYIFDGDILECRVNKYCINKLLVEKDVEQEFYYLTHNGNYVSRLTDMREYLVIGNIYENKDLLEV